MKLYRNLKIPFSFIVNSWHHIIFHEMNKQLFMLVLFSQVSDVFTGICTFMIYMNKSVQDVFIPDVVIQCIHVYIQP